jgi:hypothetical protein
MRLGLSLLMKYIILYSGIKAHFVPLSEPLQQVEVEMDLRISWEDSTRLFGSYHGAKKRPR